jgi:hypothetical protein
VAWHLQCNDTNCERETSVANIVDLISSCIDKRGRFVCVCGVDAHIRKYFELQERGESRKPFLRGVIQLGHRGDTYQPFVFLVTDTPSECVDDLWFSYYKDLRPSGRLKLGHGPGGPPVLHTTDILRLLHQLKRLCRLSAREIADALT